MNKEKFCDIFEKTWEDIGYAPTKENSIFNMRERIWKNIGTIDPNGEADTSIILRETIKQFCIFFLENTFYVH